MRSVGVIAEFNPFHNGHRYLLRRARQTTKADVVTVVMSGNWVQRGIPAIVDKWRRTWMALNNGADLVIELPVQFAVQPADIFARQAVNLVARLHCHWLAFGCEHPDWNFDRLARVRIRGSRSLFHDYRFTYATLIRKNFYLQTGIKITRPNDLLALSYARAKARLKSGVRLLPIFRASRHNSESLNPRSRFVSSTALRRELIKTGALNSVRSWIPDNCLRLLQRPWLTWTSFWPLLRYRLIESSLADLRTIYQMREGLEHRLRQGAIRSVTFLQFLRFVKTKRYTYSAILRLCFYVLIHLTKSDWQRIKSRSYLRILGFSPDGRKYLNQIKKRVSIPIVTNVNQKALNDYLQWDFRAGMLFEMRLHRYEDLYQHPVIK